MSVPDETLVHHVQEKLLSMALPVGGLVSLQADDRAPEPIDADASWLAVRMVQCRSVRHVRRMTPFSDGLAHHQHDAPYRAATDTLDAGQQHGLACQSTTAVMPLASEDVG